MRGLSASKTRVSALLPCVSIAFRKLAFCEGDGLHRYSGLPEFRLKKRRESGRPDLRAKPGNDEGNTAQSSSGTGPGAYHVISIPNSLRYTGAQMPIEGR